MNSLIFPVRRQVLGLLAWGTATACLPAGVPAAWANDKDDSDWGRRRGRDRGSNDTDGQGREDSAGDRSGSGLRGRADRDGKAEDRIGDTGVRTSTVDGAASRNIVVSYADGWTERITDGSYELVDPQRRLVVRRSATAEDFDRMIAVR